MGGAIVATDQVMLGARQMLEKIVDAESARETVDSVDKLKRMLDIAEQYGEYATRFCILEAEMYLKIKDIRGADSRLTPSKRRMVDWLRRMDDAELEKIMRNEVMWGTRLQAVFRRNEGAAGVDHKRAMDKLHRKSEEIIEDCRIYGIARLNADEFMKEFSNRTRPSPDYVRPFVEHTRDKLLKAGAVGLGDGDGTYILAGKCDKEQAIKAITCRLQCIMRDLESLVSLCKRLSSGIGEETASKLADTVEKLTHEFLEELEVVA